MQTDFNNSFTVVFSDILLSKVLLKRPSHLKSTFAKVIAKIKVAPFFETQCICFYINCS